MKRQRATAVVFRHGNVLLIRDRGHKHYSLPGGGAHRRESIVAAAARELREELGMTSTGARRVEEADYSGWLNDFRVAVVDSIDGPKLSSWEVTGYLWWDMVSEVPLRNNVAAMIQAVRDTIDQNQGGDQ
ncbi:MAG: NUDIX domain-containing protein [Spirochaetales bacterium]|nr:MAG: NUDIX domain-containing protein [Spirochaetales bacterium]